jgi:hypothetical protein
MIRVAEGELERAGMLTIRPLYPNSYTVLYRLLLVNLCENLLYSNVKDFTTGFL